MNTGLKLAISLTALSFSIACGPPDDPSDKNSNANNTTTANNTTANNTTANNTTPNNTTPNNTTANNTTMMTNNMSTSGPCEVNDVFFGQIDSSSDDHAGGVPTTDPYTNDAGLAGALAMFNVMEDMTQTVDIDISGATVTATSFGTGGNANFWVQDSGAAMQVFLGFMNPVAVNVKVGDIVSFKITSFGNFQGHPQIATLDNFTVDSSGNPVSYVERTGMALTVDDYNKIVRITGTLSAVGESCGGMSNCWDLTHGGQTVIYRSASTFLNGGECVTFFGPVSGFPGPNADSMAAPDWQLDAKNFSWSWTR